MKYRIMKVFAVFVFLLFSVFQPAGAAENDKLNIVATTTMLSDLARVIGAGHVTVEGLMGPGVDPHLYQASAGDVNRMQNADVVIYNGLHLEGKMGDIFEALGNQGRPVICIADGIDESRLLGWEGGSSGHDPHVWFSVPLWTNAAVSVMNGLSTLDPLHADEFEAALETYRQELAELDGYIRRRVQELPQEQRVLITAHDAFNYFGREYGFEVRGLQGISTVTEAGTADVSALADFIVDRKIKAVFVESSIPTRSIESLQAAVRARGFDVSIGGELYSDSLGDPSSGHETYIKTFIANIDTIVNAMK